MAILKAIPRIAQERALAPKRPNVRDLRNGPLFNHDAHVQAHRDYLVSTFVGKVEICQSGKPLRAMKHWQADYRSATPKGVVLLSERVKGIHGRFASK